MFRLDQRPRPPKLTSLYDGLLTFLLVKEEECLARKSSLDEIAKSHIGPEELKCGGVTLHYRDEIDRGGRTVVVVVVVLGLGLEGNRTHVAQF